ncbi:MAG: FliM/FliN family flagellar motor switch protein [Ramlibacter sp.]|nr:FliM/FliN family flagellar motor switch protein [Ramlibacter sp.]
MNPQNASPPPREHTPHATHATAQVISLGELHGETAHRAAPSAIVNADNPLHAVRAKLQVCVGEVEMTVGDLLSATEHHVLVLDRSIEQPVDLTLEGKVVARGQLVAVDGRFALRITDLPVSLRTK